MVLYAVRVQDTAQVASTLCEAPFMVDKGVLAFERLVTERAVELVRDAGRLLLFFRAFLGSLVDPVRLLYLQSALQLFLPLLLPPAAVTSTT